MLQFSHSTRTISHMWKIGSKRRKILMYSLVDLTLNTSFNVSSNCYTITKKEPSIMIIDKSPTLKLFLEMEKDNLLYIFRYDAWWHPNLG